MTPLILIHGEKGGVGKSFTATLLTDHLLLTGKNPIPIDCDGSAPDIAKRYIDRAIISELDAEADRFGDGIERLAKAIEDAAGRNPDAIIVNLPGAASTKLDGFASEVKEIAHALGLSFHVVFMADDRVDEGKRLFNESRLVKAADNVLVIHNGKFGSVHPKSVAVEQDGIVLDELPAFAVRTLVDHPATPVSRLIDSTDAPMLSRSRLRNWLHSGQEVAKRLGL